MAFETLHWNTLYFTLYEYIILEHTVYFVLGRWVVCQDDRDILNASKNGTRTIFSLEKMRTDKIPTNRVIRYRL